MRSYQLSLAGPSEVDPRVLQELVRPNLPHYGDLWVPTYRGVLEKLKKAYRTAGRAFVLPSSGSGAIDAAFGSLGAKKVLVLNNGNFGSRLAEIAHHHASQLTVIEKEAGQAFPLEQVESEFKTGRHDLLAMVHGETSTGMLNQLEGLVDLCRRHDVLFFVDAVSTLGGVPLEMDSLGVDFCVSASQKALGGLPGLSTIAVSERGWRRLAPEEQIKGWYLNLRTWDRFAIEWGDWHPYPVTLPVHLFFAFDKALELLLEEGLETRWRRHEGVRKALQEKLLAMDIPLLIDREENRLATVTAATLPAGFSSADLIRHLREKHGILIAGGVGPLRERIFRIGHMGYSSQHWLVNRVAAAIQDYLHE
jgi:alanine-glyoxylate transaminase/serine-glyoxylate transaminase/serine-pyruvate transaminase